MLQNQAARLEVVAVKSERMNLETTLTKISKQSIGEGRQKILDAIVDYIQQKQQAGQVPQLNFICTHNSRRSQLSQVWAFVLSRYFDVPVASFSGGVEVTAFNANAVKALETCGLDFQKKGTENPIYSFQYKGDRLDCFSKVYDAKTNPEKEFAAVMTCNHADQNCPYIPGAEIRIPLTFNDPKVSDGTPSQDVVYLDRSLEIAGEMYYVFNKVAKQ